MRNPVIASKVIRMDLVYGVEYPIVRELRTDGTRYLVEEIRTHSRVLCQSQGRFCRLHFDTLEEAQAAYDREHLFAAERPA